MAKASKKNREIEVRFLEVDAPKLKKILTDLGAKDCGKSVLTASIFYDKERNWRKNGQSKFVRVRQDGKKSTLTYKHFIDKTPAGTEEIEVEVSDGEKTMEILTRIGLEKARVQEKRRHSFTLGGIMFDFDSWPKVPTFLEIEGKSEKDLKKGAKLLGLSWKDSVTGNVGSMIQEIYKIPVLTLSFYTFKKIQ